MKKYKIELECEVDYKGDVLFAIPNDGHWVYGFGDYVKQHGTEIKDPVTYKPGDRFRHSESGMEYMLVCTELGDPHEHGATVHLVNADTGLSVTLPFSPKDHGRILSSEIPVCDIDMLVKIEDGK